jgi:hypothetical protein
MKVIDKTPFQDENGRSGLWQRFQGLLEYGYTWRGEVDAQKNVIAQLDRVLEKGYTLIRNLNLENSKIIEPLVLVGPPGVFVIYVTDVKGYFEAKGDEWNIVNNDRRTPAQVNLLKRVARLARAVQVYLSRQGVYLPGVVEPILVAASPRVHVDSLRPVVRVVLSDAVKQFGASLLQARPILRPEAAHEVVDHLLNPRRKAVAAQAEPAETAPQEPDQAADAPQRARAIFQAAEEAKPFDPADLEFEYDEHGDADLALGLEEAAGPQMPARARSIGGFTSGQWFALIGLFMVELVLLGGFVFLLLFGAP